MKPRKPELIPEWRKCWRMLSVQMAAVLVIWVTLPLEYQSAILAALGVAEDRVTAVLGVLIIAARVIQQPSLDR